ncbi:MAG: SGNH/GDSL hydrolase family protein [Candidatus Competibacteraceae bacterium]
MPVDIPPESPHAPGSWWTSGLLGATTIAGALVVGLLLAEVLLRLAGFSYPNFYCPDSSVGRTNIPGAAGWFTDEGRAYIEINSDGLRDREHALIKPAGTVRIAVLGDSFAAAFQVAADQTFWGRLAPALEACPTLGGRHIEVINFGVVGFGTAQEYLMLKSRVWKYAPDVVLLAFLTANDISDNARALKQSDLAAYFVHQDGKLVEDPLWLARSEKLRPGALDPLWDPLYAHSRVLQLLAKAREQIKLLIAGDRPPALAIPGQEPGLYEAVYREPRDPVWREAWSVTEDLIRTMASEVRSHGAQFMLVTLSNGIQVHPDPTIRRTFAEHFEVTDLFYPDHRIEALARDAGIPYLMLAPSLLAWAEANGKCVHGFDNATPCAGHWNENGHRLAGEMIAAKLCHDILPELAEVLR